MDENSCREQMSPTDVVEAGRAIEALEKERAKERQRAGGRAGGQASGKLPEASTGQSRDRVAGALGVSGSLGIGRETYRKAKQVVEASEEDPDTFGDLPGWTDGCR